MKIAMMTNNYKPFIGGVPISIERLSESLRGMGHQVVVFAPTYENQEEREEVVRYHSLIRGIVGGVSIPNSLDPKIEKEFKEGDFDVIHVHHPMLIGRTALYLSKKYGIPLVFTYHTRYEQYLHYVGMSCLKGAVPLYIREFTGHCDMVIAPTPKMKEVLSEMEVTAPVTILPTGITQDSFQAEEKTAGELRSRLLGNRGVQGEEEDKQLFVSVSRLAKEKNIPFLFKSLKLYKEKLGKSFRLALIGDGPEKEHLKKLSAEMGLTEEIIFVGKVPNTEVKNYCKAADLFLFASTSETQGIVLLESMAAGTPVLAVKATGTEDIVADGKNGYMTQEKEEEFADRLMDILEKKELDFLRAGAEETALSYHSSFIARRALITYRAAMQIRKNKEQMRQLRRNAGRNMIYSQSSI